MEITVGMSNLKERRGQAWSLLLGILAASLYVCESLAMDRVRSATRVDDAVARFNVSGQGVLIAVLDRGIDWKNADFRNDDGSTRIEFIFDLTDDRGAGSPGNLYGMGTIYTKEDINRALTGGPSLTTRDAIGHGTTTTAS